MILMERVGKTTFPKPSSATRPKGDCAITPILSAAMIMENAPGMSFSDPAHAFTVGAMQLNRLQE